MNRVEVAYSCAWLPLLKNLANMGTEGHRNLCGTSDTAPSLIPNCSLCGDLLYPRIYHTASELPGAMFYPDLPGQWLILIGRRKVTELCPATVRGWTCDPPIIAAQGVGT